MQMPGDRLSPTEKLKQAMESVNDARAELGLPPIPAPDHPSTIYAYTPPGSMFPPYLNVTRLESGRRIEHDDYIVTVRSPQTMTSGPGGEYPQIGECGQIAIPRVQLLALFRALQREFGDRA